ncbi:MAG: hypothetical protein EXS46_02700 [Candidatus Taylorbacteria bacterium]|nr:hypothetical protein [Candidatus Taylorbacteria bacterium]
MPIELKHLGGVKRPVALRLSQNRKRNKKIPNGAKVVLMDSFKTGSGQSYPEGSRGVKVGQYRYGWMVKMEDGGHTITVPSHMYQLKLSKSKSKSKGK